MRVCVRGMPSDWSAMFSQTAIALGQINFSPSAVDSADNVAFGYFQSGSKQGIAAVGLLDGKVRMLSQMSPQQSGVTWMSFGNSWLAWAQGESLTNLGAWSIQALDTVSGRRIQLATSKLPDGTYLNGQLAFPVVGRDYVAWSQPTSQNSADLRIYRLDTGQTLTLDSGHLSSPVVASNKLVWAKLDSGQTLPSFRMVDANTLNAVAVPGLLGTPRPIGYLAGSPEYLLWTTDNSTLIAADMGTGKLRKFLSPDVMHPFQFPMIAGHFLVWFSGPLDAVLDLVTGGTFDLPLPGGAAGADNDVVITKSAAGSKGTTTNSTIATMRLTPATTIPGCKH